ncbi:MAG TPA: hypothetical protein VFA52_02835 [Candidatus Paceibacterota bacterium]|nr:hypothetical protein [Candidatus Paceibacterota bacterium]
MKSKFPESEPAKVRIRKSRKMKCSSESKTAAETPHLAAAGSLTRTKALLLAALRVWELKHRISHDPYHQPR